MAKLVLAVGVPHPPRLVREMQDAPGQLPGERLMKRVRQYVEKANVRDTLITPDRTQFTAAGQNHQGGHADQTTKRLKAGWDNHYLAKLLATSHL